MPCRRGGHDAIAALYERQFNGAPRSRSEQGPSKW